MPPTEWPEKCVRREGRKKIIKKCGEIYTKNKCRIVFLQELGYIEV